MKDGDQAFPHILTPTGHMGYGMTLRDYFAGQALHLFSLETEDIHKLESGLRPQHERVAVFCYQLADAMLAAREAEASSDS